MSPLHPLVIGGLTRFSTVDYPGYIAAVIHCQGCPWRCTYCHNPHLQPVDAAGEFSWHDIADWLDSRHGLLEAVVFSGGEPLLQRGLACAMYQVREMGYRVALHTAGIYSDRLAGILPLVDWIGFDVKAAFEDYGRITRAKGGCEARRSLSLLLAAGKPHEIRCTVDEDQLSVADGERLAKQAAQLGVDRLVLQAKRDVDGRVQAISAPFVAAVGRNMAHVEVR